MANEYIRAVKENPTLFGEKNGTVPFNIKIAKARSGGSQ